MEKKHYIKFLLPKKGETKKAILRNLHKRIFCRISISSFNRLSKKIKKKVQNLNEIKKIDIFTSHHTHYVIGTGANDPQKMDPNASRETLDHSIMYIFAVALEDGDWHHVKSYTKARAKRKSTIKIWRSIKTHEDKKWTKNIMIQTQKIKHLVLKLVVTTLKMVKKLLKNKV